MQLAGGTVHVPRGGVYEAAHAGVFARVKRISLTPAVLISVRMASSVPKLNELLAAGLDLQSADVCGALQVLRRHQACPLPRLRKFAYLTFNGKPTRIGDMNSDVARRNLSPAHLREPEQTGNCQHVDE